MEGLIDSQHGLATLLASLVIILSLHLFLQLAKIVWALLKTKSTTLETNVSNLAKAIEQNTIAYQKLELRLSKLEIDLSTLPKVKIDLRRIFNVIRYLAGKDWQKFRKIMDDDLEP